jgi:hypothetical protein
VHWIIGSRVCYPATELETRVLESALIIHILENTPIEDMRQVLKIRKQQKLCRQIITGCLKTGEEP